METPGEEFLNGLSASGRSFFKERLVRKNVQRHQSLIEKGDVVSGAYFVLKGTLRVFTLGSNGREATLYCINAGETCVLALNALFNDLLYPAWVKAEADTVIGVLPGDAYRTLFATETVLQDLTVRALSAAVFGLMTSLEERTVRTVEQRIASFLLLNARADHSVHNTQQEIADRIGTTREVVGRHMAQFAADGLLRSGRGTVVLLDVRLLSDMASYVMGEAPLSCD